MKYAVTTPTRRRNQSLLCWMRKNYARRLYGLPLALIVLVIGIALLFTYANVAASGEQLDTGSIQSAHAQENPLSFNRWSSNGPDGGSVSSLAIDRSNPATIYAGTPTGVFKSTNRGESWSSSLTNTYVQIVAVAPATPTTVYAGTQSGVFKSADGGTSWNAINNGLENQYGPVYIVALAIDPTNSNIIYASGPDIDLGGTYRAIYKTTNGGGSWSIIKHSINSFAIHRTLVIDPINPNIIYAAGSVGNGTVWKSTNSGNFWSIVNVGLDSRSTVYGMAIDPTNTNIIYVGTETLGVYKSTDGGGSWSAFNDGLPDYHIDDNGQRYFHRVSSIMIDPVNPNIVYAGTYGGVFKNSNGGSWSVLISGINLGVNALAIDRVNTNIMYTGTDGGIFKSSNGGASWSTINKGLRGINVSSLGINPGNANIYAGTGGDTFKSTDNGGNWNPNNFFPLAFDPRNPNIIYARVGDSYQLSKSTNNGATWVSVHPGSQDSYASLAVVDPSNSAVVYAVTDGLHKSTDGGGSWSAIGGYFYPSVIVIDPRNSNVLYASYDDCYSNSLYKSIDGGVNWKISSGDGGLSLIYGSPLVIDPINTATLYTYGCTFGVNSCGLYKSTDSAGSWKAIGSGLPGNGVSSLVIDPVHPNNLYAGTYGDGVFKSADSGTTWNPLNDGLTNLNINALAIDRAGNFLHAATPAGVFDYQNIATGTEPVVLTGDQATLRSWTYQGRTYAYAKLSFPNAGYFVSDWGLPTRSGNDFTVDARVERFTAPSIQAVVTTAQIYDLGPLPVGTYNFNFKTSGTLAKTLQFSVTSATPPPPNPIDTAREFVRQQYRDFLNREADQAGENFWTGEITQCTTNPATRLPGESEAACIVRKRANTSAAFFLSPEFQYTGYYVYRMYQGALGRQPKVSEFTPDAQFVAAGILVNGQLSGARINQNKADFAQQFVNCTDATKYRCAEFKAIYDGLNNQQYVDKLFQTTGVNASALDRAALVNGLNGGTETRASVLQKVVDGIVVISEGNQQFTTSYGQAFYNSEFNRAFVELEYFGYMKRDPDDAGYAFWLGKLNQFGGNFVNAEMVLAFISSPEYRARFGQP